MWRVAIGELGDVTESGTVQVVEERCQESCARGLLRLWRARGAGR
jgi:hypothetical protein